MKTSVLMSTNYYASVDSSPPCRLPDSHSLDHVVLGDLVDHRHALIDDATHRGVLAIQRRVRRPQDEDLTIGFLGLRSISIREPDYAALEFALRHFDDADRPHALLWPAAAGAPQFTLGHVARERVADLHDARLDPVKQQTSVETCLREFEDSARRLRRLGNEQLDFDVALDRRQNDDGSRRGCVAALRAG